MRKLASIQQILDIQPIEGADSIEAALILGWQVVVQKGQFQVGDLVVYCEIDSILPEREEFEFLRKVGFRIKTIKLRGQISQGICFPLSILEGFIKHPRLSSILYFQSKGFDLTSILGIKKYDSPEVSVKGQGMQVGLSGGLFPSYIPKTDETRIQSTPSLLQKFNRALCYITTKIDGTSATFAIKGGLPWLKKFFPGKISICSRNTIRKKDLPNIYWEMAKKYNIIGILKKYGNIAIQGEIAGPGIQKNKLGLEEKQLFVFDVYDIKKKKYYNYFELDYFCSQNNLQMVPVEDSNFNLTNRTIPELLDLAKGFYPNGHVKEGIVLRTILSFGWGRMSFKVINQDFLFKEESCHGSK